jgi:hypothetical protein
MDLYLAKYRNTVNWEGVTVSAKIRFVFIVGTVTAVVFVGLIALWRGGELAYWHIGVGAAVALTALLKNIIVYRNSVGVGRSRT